MTTTGAQEWVAELYDAYVTTTVDIPFFVAEAREAPGPVLELMAGTGRVSLPLAEAGARLTRVDLSGPMLAQLRAKLGKKGLSADTVEMNISQLSLTERDFALAILPFQSFAELLTPEDQRAALRGIAGHLTSGGRFICTLHNPRVRRRTIDGQLRLLGTFPLPDGAATLLLWSLQRQESDMPVVRATQFYEVYDHDGRLQEKLWLDARFRLVEQAQFQAMAEASGFRVLDLYGNYDCMPFDEDASPFMIWILERCA